MVCLDTSFLIALLRRDLLAEKKLAGYVSDDVKLSTTFINVCELFKGAYRSKRRAVEVEKVKSVLSFMEVLDFSIDACERFGKLVNELPLLNYPVGDMDTLIACLALSHGEPVLTSNRKHFERIPGLLVETW